MKKLSWFAFVWLALGSTGYSADFFCTSGNVGCLISAIDVSNGNGQDNTIFLEVGDYTLRSSNGTNPNNGLPAITGRIRITGPEGIGSTIEIASGVGLRIFEIAAGGNVVLDWLGLRNGRPVSVSAERCGGAILNRGTLAINRSAIYGNRTDLRSGGAICNLGSLSITHSELRSNFTGDDSGGAISSSGTLHIEDCFLSGNVSNFGAAILSTGTGFMLRTTVTQNSGIRGAIFSSGTFWIEDSSINQNRGGAIFNTGSITIVNTTMFQNMDGLDGLGGGSGILNSGNVFLKNSSVIANISQGLFNAGATGIQNTGTLRIQNSILALNLRSNSPSDCNAITSLGNNIIGSLEGCSVGLRSTDFVGDPGVGPFTEDAFVNGSGHLPLMPGSPAIGHGNNGACTPRDQLGEPRHGHCDIGAVEFQRKHEDESNDNKHRISQGR
jgi:hypothetical protein